MKRILFVLTVLFFALPRGAGAAHQISEDEAVAETAASACPKRETKNDPIWIAISDFGLPWPPFKLGSGMWLKCVGWDECVDLGLVQEGRQVVQLPPLKVNIALEGIKVNKRPWLFNRLESSLGQEGLVVERLAQVPPMTRLVVIDYFTRSWAQGQMKFSMTYTEREYGCCADWNQHYVQWVDFFEPPTKLEIEDAPWSLKKDLILARLEAAGVQVKKTTSRKRLLVLLNERPDLLASTLRELCPEACAVKPEWKAPLEAWLARYHQMLDVAGEVYKSLLLQNW